MEKLRKYLPTAALIAAAVTFIMNIVSAFIPAIVVDGTGYARWQVTFFYEPDFILDKKMFDPNALLIAAFVLPIIVTIVTLCMWKNAKAFKRAVLMTILSIASLFSAIVTFCTTSLALTNATARMLEIINPAIENGTYSIGVMSVVVGAVGIIVCLLSVGAAVVNYQISSTKEYKAEMEARKRKSRKLRKRSEKGLFPSLLLPSKQQSSVLFQL